jgi:cation transport regulator ChaC
MAEIRTTPLMTMKLAVSGMQAIGATPNGNRRIGLVAGGTFEGPRLKGTVLPGGADWIIVRPDASTTLDVRLVLQTDDGATIGMTYRGMRHGPTAVMDRVNKGEMVDPSAYYFRTAVVFETASEKYDWLNRVIAIGTGHRPPEGPVYDIFEVL